MKQLGKEVQRMKDRGTTDWKDGIDKGTKVCKDRRLRGYTGLITPQKTPEKSPLLLDEKNGWFPKDQ